MVAGEYRGYEEINLETQDHDLKTDDTKSLYPQLLASNLLLLLSTDEMLKFKLQILHCKEFDSFLPTVWIFDGPVLSLDLLQLSILQKF